MIETVIALGSLAAAALLDRREERYGAVAATLGGRGSGAGLGVGGGLGGRLLTSEWETELFGRVPNDQVAAQYGGAPALVLLAGGASVPVILGPAAGATLIAGGAYVLYKAAAHGAPTVGSDYEWDTDSERWKTTIDQSSAQMKKLGIKVPKGCAWILTPDGILMRYMQVLKDSVGVPAGGTAKSKLTAMSRAIKSARNKLAGVHAKRPVVKDLAKARLQLNAAQQAAQKASGASAVAARANAIRMGSKVAKLEKMANSFGMAELTEITFLITQISSELFNPRIGGTAPFWWVGSEALASANAAFAEELSRCWASTRHSLPARIREGMKWFVHGVIKTVGIIATFRVLDIVFEKVEDIFDDSAIIEAIDAARIFIFKAMDPDWTPKPRKNKETKDKGQPGTAAAPQGTQPQTDTSILPHDEPDLMSHAQWSSMGVDAFLLAEDGTRYEQGNVPPGIYQIMARMSPDQSYVPGKTVTLKAGRSYAFSCYIRDDGRKACRLSS